MNRLWLRLAASAVLLAVVAVATWMFLPRDLLGFEHAPADQKVVTKLADPALIERGRYLAIVGDCAACHTDKGGRPYAGGHSLPTPFGTIPAPNITPDEATGIGLWTFAEFWGALHLGHAPDGTLFYPVFPFLSYTRVTRDDALALFAYLKSLPPVRQADGDPKMDFPYNLRGGMRAWRALYFTPGVFQPDPQKSQQWNRGAYLVQGLGHCQACHSQRTTLGGLEEGRVLAGGHIPEQGWYAPGLSTAEGGDLEGWSKEDIVQSLKTGRSARGTVVGPMADVVRLSTSHMTQADLEAIAVYLASLPPRPKAAPATVVAATDLALGAKIYADACAGCHGVDGRGVPGKYPPLDGNISVTGSDGINAIRTVLLGGFPPATEGNPQPYSMPPFAPEMGNSEVAAVVNYTRQSWSNMAAPVTASDVQRYRYAPTR